MQFQISQKASNYHSLGGRIFYHAVLDAFLILIYLVIVFLSVMYKD